MKTPISKTLLLALLLCLPSLALGQNLITNGSFELGPFSPGPEGYEEYPVGSAALSDWMIITDDVARVENGNSFGITASKGTKFLDLAGRDDAPPHGGVVQTIPTTVGQHYSFSMDLGTFQDIPIAAGPITVTVSIGSTSRTFTHNPTGSGNQWAGYGFDFTAETAQTTVTIQGIIGSAYIGLDNVSVVSLSGAQNVTIDAYAGLTITGPIGTTYRVQYTLDLNSPSWINLADIVLSESPYIYFDPVAIKKTPKRFYRAFVAP